MPSLAQKQQAIPSIPVSYFSVIRDSLERAALTGSMLFDIFIGATAFSLVL
jgi:TRAP-type mannitol/chloroaromatic compound transport system permease large subunit